MRRRRIASLILGLWVLFCAPLAAGPPPVSIVNRHSLGMPPFYPQFSVKIEPHEANRKLCIRWGNVQWDENLWNVSCQQIDGLTSKRTYFYPVSNARVIREMGEFVLEAELIRSDKSFKTRTRLYVGGLPPDEPGDF